jgi:hypothetical protein
VVIGKRITTLGVFSVRVAMDVALDVFREGGVTRGPAVASDVLPFGNA